MSNPIIPTKPINEFGPLLEETKVKIIKDWGNRIIEHCNNDPATNRPSHPSLWFHIYDTEVGILEDNIHVIDNQGNEVFVPIAEVIAYALLVGQPYNRP